MPTFHVTTPGHSYPCVVESGAARRLAEYLPERRGKIFVATDPHVWEIFGRKFGECIAPLSFDVLTFPGGEPEKRLAHIETLAEQMIGAGGDRRSVVVAFGGGIVNDMGGFLASIFMRGVPVVQVPTTLLAQVDAAIGGKTAVNLRAGKNLIGTFHQPLAVLVDPAYLTTLSDREYRAGLFEIIKAGVIASPELFDLLEARREEVLARRPEIVERIISESVRIKAEVVSADERESDMRRILNFGHTIGHALEAETAYSRFLHGEAVAFGMAAATHLAEIVGLLPTGVRDRVLALVRAYGPVPPLDGIRAEALAARLVSDKKTIAGKVHFVLPDRVGHVVVRSGIPDEQVLAATRAALAA